MSFCVIWNNFIQSSMTTKLSFTTSFQINFKLLRFGTANVQSQSKKKSQKYNPTVINIFEKIRRQYEKERRTKYKVTILFVTKNCAQYLSVIDICLIILWPSSQARCLLTRNQGTSLPLFLNYLVYYQCPRNITTDNNCLDKFEFLPKLWVTLMPKFRFLKWMDNIYWRDVFPRNDDNDV